MEQFVSENLFGKKDEEVQNFVVDEPLKPLRFDDEINVNNDIMDS